MIKKESRNALRERRHIRLRKHLKGTSEAPRLAVYRSNRHIECQLIDDSKGITLCSSGSTQLKLEHGNNIEAARKVGADIAAKALKLGIKKVVYDRGGYAYHGRVAALADAVREGGLEF